MSEKVLHLTLKKKWFWMIVSGEKKEEYREIKPYWIKRLKESDEAFKQFDVVCFRNGYSKSASKVWVRCNGIRVGDAKPEWSDNWKGKVFIIELGNRMVVAF